MNRRLWTSTSALAVMAACTYNEYNTYSEITGSDAGAAGTAGAAGAGQGGSSGRGGGSGGNAGSVVTAGSAGSSGSAGTGGAGSTAVDADCTGCLRLTATSTVDRNVRLELPSSQDMATTRIAWRIRPRNLPSGMYLTFYAESGDSPEQRLITSQVTITDDTDWQDLGSDLTNVSDFVAPTFFDGGFAGGAGAGFDSGFPFDKTRVQAVGVIVRPILQDGVFTPWSVEIDSLSFSDHSDLDASFDASDGGLELSDDGGAIIDGATLSHIDG